MGSAVGIVGVIGFDECFERCTVCVQQPSDGQIAGNIHNRRVDRALMVTVIFV